LGGIIAEWYRVSGHVIEALDAEGVAIGEKSWSRIPILRKKRFSLIYIYDSYFEEKKRFRKLGFMTTSYFKEVLLE
jgi:hypothetical protein